jgi:hypothetical protein
MLCYSLQSDMQGVHNLPIRKTKAHCPQRLILVFNDSFGYNICHFSQPTASRTRSQMAVEGEQPRLYGW